VLSHAANKFSDYGEEPLGCLIGGSAGLPNPWQEVCDAIDGVVCDAPEDIARVGFWIDPGELGGFDERGHGGCSRAAPIGAGEEIILTAW